MYACPMHPEVRQGDLGKCPKCGMDLVSEDKKISSDTFALSRSVFRSLRSSKRKLKDFTPLIVIFAVILGLTGLMVWRNGSFELMTAMRHFEGFFFLIFGLFKLLNWKGFVDAYSTYDIIAKRSRAYGYAYPLIELGLGLAYLYSFNLLITAYITFILMIVGSIGVLEELRKKNQIPCACLGVVFKLPMTWVTFIEDMLMAVMSLIMIGLLIK